MMRCDSIPRALAFLVALALAALPGAGAASAAEPKNEISPKPAADSKPSGSKPGAAKPADGKVQESSPTDREIAQLIEQLGDAEFAVRELAQNRLEKIGVPAFDALALAESHPDPEVALRSRMLLRSIRVSWVFKEDPPAVRKALANYEQQMPSEREDVIRSELARLPDDVYLSPLVRLVRFERSTRLAKYAAMAILSRTPDSGAITAAQAKTIAAGLGSSKRTAAVWLRTAISFQAEPETALTVWNKLAETEADLFQTGSPDSDRELARMMRKQQYRLLLARGQRDRLGGVLNALTALLTTNDTDLWIHARWLADQKEWKNIEEIGEKFKKQFERNPVLLYLVAQAKHEQGAKDEAEKLAAEASKLLPESDRIHLIAAYRLQENGLFAWAEREYRNIFARTSDEYEDRLRAALLLAGMLDDQLRFGESAELRKKFLALIDDEEVARQTFARMRRSEASDGIPSIRSRMHYALARDAQAKGDAAAQLHNLEEALKHDPHEADVLIELFRYPKLPDTRRAEIRRQIEVAAATIESRIKVGEETLARENATHYNQYAWLIANTEGDVDRAIRYSELSLKIVPDAAGYLDTLATCYFAKGNFDKAIEIQTKAQRLEPHSGDIRRQLEKFKKAKAEKKPG